MPVCERFGLSVIPAMKEAASVLQVFESITRPSSNMHATRWAWHRLKLLPDPKRQGLCFVAMLSLAHHSSAVNPEGLTSPIPRISARIDSERRFHTILFPDAESTSISLSGSK